MYVYDLRKNWAGCDFEEVPGPRKSYRFPGLAEEDRVQTRGIRIVECNDSDSDDGGGSFREITGFNFNGVRLTAACTRGEEGICAG